jgi:hypothetical protein
MVPCQLCSNLKRLLKAVNVTVYILWVMAAAVHGSELAEQLLCLQGEEGWSVVASSK